MQITVEEICGIEEKLPKNKWMTMDILEKMEERIISTVYLQGTTQGNQNNV